MSSEFDDFLKAQAEKVKNATRVLWKLGKFDGRGHKHTRENSRRLKQIEKGMIKVTEGISSISGAALITPSGLPLNGNKAEV